MSILADGSDQGLWRRAVEYFLELAAGPDGILPSLFCAQGMAQSRELYTSDIILNIMFLNDLRYALRLMRRSPCFTAVAVLSLALGIGANTAIYSLFYTIMLRQLPVAHPGQLVEFLFSGDPGQVRDDGYWDWDRYEYIRDHNHVLSALTGMSFDNLASLRVDGSDPQTVIEESVLGNYFEVLGLKPAIGRLTTPDDVPASGEGEAAVVIWSWWNSRFHRDPSILGKRIFVNDQPRTIVGVAPRGYSGPRVGSRTDVWIPYQKDTVRLLARIKPGVPRQQAQAEMRVLLQSLVEQKAARNHTKVKPIQLDVEPAGAGFARVREQYGKALMLLLVVVGLLLLLACINMASLLLARSAGRQRELAVRVGLGAGRGRLVRQMLTEAVMLSAAGTLAASCWPMPARASWCASWRAAGRSSTSTWKCILIFNCWR